jgi:hypothetical protein
MSINPTLVLRKDELARRVKSLPEEIAAWRTRAHDDPDANAHFSQLAALEVLLSTFQERQKSLLDALDPAGDGGAFGSGCLELVKELIRAQRVWDFFRSKLNLRFVPGLKEPLWVADTVAWDCYRSVLDRAADEGIVARHELREPPLTYLTAEFSPATWVRGSRPNDGRNYALGTALLPIPVIELPWDHLENVWEFLSLHHEVGHDIEADLQLRAPLVSALQTQLAAAGVPAERVRVWRAWQAEVFADLVGLQLGGPAFAEALLHLLLLPPNEVASYNAADPHPTHYVRILMNAAYARTLVPGRLELDAHAGAIEELWWGLYGRRPEFAPLAEDFPHVFRALMDTPLAELKGRRVRELMPFTATDDGRIRYAASYLLTGQDAPEKIDPRHCVSATRLAATGAAKAGGNVAAALKDINEKASQLIRDNALPGLRAFDDSTPHKKFIAGFAAMLPI